MIKKAYEEKATTVMLDRDRNLFMKIKSFITTEKLSKVDHLKDVILMLREYVKVGEVEKKKYGEVMTPLELVKEMLATLPKEVWSNPNLKWLDPANGTGPYPLIVIWKLMEGLKEWEPDAEKRYKHIVENMIYVCELQPKNMFLYMCLVDPYDEYHLNVYTGSFLTKEFDYHMKEVWGLEKFDIVMGNPPYQDSSKISRNSTFWTKFICKSFYELLNINGYLCFITPGSWMGSTEGQRNLIRDVFTEYNLLFLDLECSKFFSGVGSTFTYYTIKNDRNHTGTKIKNNNKIFQIDIRKFPFLSKSMSKISLSIINKLTSIETKIGVSSNFRNDKFDDNGPYKVHYSNGFKRSSVIGKNALIKKVIINLPGYLNPRYDDGVYATSKNNFWIPVKNEIEGKSLISYLNSSLIRFITQKECKYSGFNNIGVMKSLPLVSLDKEWTDEQLFDYFNLTKEERELVINYDKKK